MSKVLVQEGVERETLSIGTNLMVVKFTFKKGADVPWHTHPHEQSSYIESGCLKLFVEEEEIILTKGMSAVISPNVKHKAKALEDTVDINSFTPIREDYL